MKSTVCFREAEMEIGRLKKLISKYKKKHQFMARVAYHFGHQTDDYELIEKAWDAAVKAHHGKKRDDGSQLFSHERGVALILMEKLSIRDSKLIAAAFLHDLMEDYPETWTFEVMSSEFGTDCALIVSAVTKPEKLQGETDDEHSRRMFDKVLIGGISSCILKCADRLHNMLTLWGSHSKKLKKIKQTIVYVAPIAAITDVLWRELGYVTTFQANRLTLQS